MCVFVMPAADLILITALLHSLVPWDALMPSTCSPRPLLATVRYKN